MYYNDAQSQIWTVSSYDKLMVIPTLHTRGLHFYFQITYQRCKITRAFRIYDFHFISLSLVLIYVEKRTKGVCKSKIRIKHCSSSPCLKATKSSIFITKLLLYTESKKVKQLLVSFSRENSVSKWFSNGWSNYAIERIWEKNITHVSGINYDRYHQFLVKFCL